MKTTEGIILALGVGGVALGGYAVYKGVNIQQEIGKGLAELLSGNQNVFGGIPDFSNFLSGLSIPIDLSGLSLPSIQDLTSPITKPITEGVKSVTDTITGLTSGVSNTVDSITKGISNIPNSIASGISKTIQSVPLGVSQGITLSIQNNPIATSVVAGAGVGAVMGSIIPVVGTLVGAGLGALTGLISSGTYHKIIPDFKSALSSFHSEQYSIPSTISNIISGGGGASGVGGGFSAPSLSEAIAVRGGGGVSVSNQISSSFQSNVQTPFQSVAQAPQKIFENLTPSWARGFIK